MKKVAEQHIFTKCCKCNTFEVISDLVHDFMNFNALKIIKKIYLKKSKTDPGLILTQENLYLWPSTYMQDMREIPAIVTEKIVIKS